MLKKGFLLNIHIKFLIARLLEILFVFFVSCLYFKVFVILIPSYSGLLMAFFLIPLLLLIKTIYFIVDDVKFSKYIEKHNDLKEYLISYAELKHKHAEVFPMLEVKLKDELNKKNIHIPIDLSVTRIVLYGTILLEILILILPFIKPIPAFISFDRGNYTVFSGKAVTVKLKGKRLPYALSVAGKDTVFYVPLKNSREVTFKSPRKSGVYIMTCKDCISARLTVLERPRITAFASVLSPDKKVRVLNRTDYVLVNTRVKLKLNLEYADSAIAFINNIKTSAFESIFKRIVTLKNNVKIRVRLFSKDRCMDTMLFNIIAVYDLPPLVTILYPENIINPMLSDTQRIVAYAKDDIGLSKVFAVLYSEGFKRLVFEKNYQNRIEDTLYFSIYNTIFPERDEVNLRIIAIDVSGKEGYYEIKFKQPGYEDRLKAFLSLRDSIKSHSKLSAETDEFGTFEKRLKERSSLNSVEIEKLKREMQKSIEDVRRLQKNMENVRMVVENLRKITDDKDLMKVMQEFNSVFMKMLDKHMKEFLKQLSTKRKVDTMSSKQLSEYIENLSKHRDDILRELKKMKEFMDAVEKELAKEEFLSRFEQLKDKESYIEKETRFFKTLKGLAIRQERIERALDSLAKISPELGKRFKGELRSLKSLMKEAEKDLKNGKRTAALKKESNIIKNMENLRKEIRSLLTRQRKERTRISIKKIRRLKNNLYFMNIVSSPSMNNKQKAIYKDALSLSLSITDSMDAVTYVRIFKAIALLRMAKEFVMAKPHLSFGLVNQAIYYLLKRQKSIMKGGGSGTSEELKDMLRKLLSRQSGLTKEINGMLPLPTPFSRNMKALLSEYGRMQEKLRKMAEKLGAMAQGKEGKEIQKAMEEMKKAENELKSGDLSQATLQHQRKALKHLLTAYRSIRKKELSQKRISTPGKAFIPDIPKIPEEIIISGKIEELYRKSVESGKFAHPFLREYIKSLRKTYEEGKK